MEVGDAFVNIDPGSSSHLWIVIAKVSNEVAIVNFRTKPSFSPDDTCVVTQDEHPFVQRDTIVNYQRGKVVEEAVLEGARQHGYLDMRAPLSPELLRRIQAGALISPYTPQKVQDAVRDTTDS